MTVASGDHLPAARPARRFRPRGRADRATIPRRRPGRFPHRPPQPRLHRPGGPGRARHRRDAPCSRPTRTARRATGWPRGRPGCWPTAPRSTRPARSARSPAGPADSVPVMRTCGPPATTAAWSSPGAGGPATRAAWARRSSTGAPGWRWPPPATCWPTASSARPRSTSSRSGCSARSCPPTCAWWRPAGVDIAVRCRPGQGRLPGRGRLVRRAPAARRRAAVRGRGHRRPRHRRGHRHGRRPQHAARAGRDRGGPARAAEQAQLRGLRCSPRASPEP